MATYSISPASGTAGHPSKAPDLKCVSVVVDFSSTTNAANDIFECITVPANTYVVTAGIDVITADTAGNSGTVGLGDGADVDRYVTTAATTSAGLMTIRERAGHSGMSTTSISYGIYAASDTIDIKITTGAVNCVVRVFALTADFGGYAGDDDGQVVTFA
jgi:hypothetical protein